MGGSGGADAPPGIKLSCVFSQPQASILFGSKSSRWRELFTLLDFGSSLKLPRIVGKSSAHRVGVFPCALILPNAIQSCFNIWIFYIWRVAFLRLPREPNYRLGKNWFCRQSAPRESSGRTDYTNLHHFPVRVFSVRGHSREVPRMRHLLFEIVYLTGSS